MSTLSITTTAAALATITLGTDSTTAAATPNASFKMGK